jgi:hypothetical protein
MIRSTPTANGIDDEDADERCKGAHHQRIQQH